MRRNTGKIVTAVREINPGGNLLEVFFGLQVLAPVLCLIYMVFVPQVADTPLQVQFNLIAVWLVISSLFFYFRGSFSASSRPGLSPSVSSSKLPGKASKSSSATSDQDWIQLFHSFEVDHLYRQPGLTIGSLARKLNIPLYRLRQLVNKRLGYQNFKEFLHEYRIRDACEALSNPDQAHLPILTIALSSGYQSINPFNRAFRKLKGMTPSDFRRQSLSEQ